MRNLEDIERELVEAREALAHVEGTPTEVYSRIVGYYRSVRNWNRGKREEYGERKPFDLKGTVKVPPVSPTTLLTPMTPLEPELSASLTPGGVGEDRVLLFVRTGCPACPGAKEAARRLGIPVDLINADTDSGRAEAQRRQVQSTPTAILLAKDGKEVSRAWDPRTIASFSKLVGAGAGDFKQAASL